MKLLDGYYEGSLKDHLRKNFCLSIPLTNSTNSKTKLDLEPNSMEEVMATSLLESSHPNLEEDAEDFIQEESRLEEPLDLEKSELPSKPPIELKPLPYGLKYAFLKGDHEAPVIISDKLSVEETFKLLTILEKH